MRILYLGLDPSRFVHQGCLVHYPIIRTVPLQGPKIEEIQALWPAFTHVLFTSRTAVQLLPQDLKGKQICVIGKATAAALASQKGVLHIAPTPTQEGMIDLLRTLDLQKAYFFYPRSALSRDVLENFFQQQRIRAHIVDLYETLVQIPGPLPDLNAFDEIVFTSPSTVHAFKQIFGSLPEGKRSTAIGPITAQALERLLR